MSAPEATATPQANPGKSSSAHDKLVNSIQGNIIAFLTDFKQEVAKEFATQNVQIGAILARLEALEHSSAGGKRAARNEKKTAPAAQNGQAPAAAGAAAGANDGREKVKNSLLYCRWAAYHDAEFRETFLTSKPEVMQAVRAADSVKKAGTEGTEKWWLNAGAAAWKSGLLAPETKTEITRRFGAWKDGNTRAAMPENLGADSAPPPAAAAAAPPPNAVDDLEGIINDLKE